MTLIKIYLAVLVALSHSAAPRKRDIRTFNTMTSSFNQLIRRLDHDHEFIRASLRDQEDEEITVNEVSELEDFDYFMDQKAVKRAWARDRAKKHQQYMNTHFVKLATENMKMVLSTAKCQIPTRRCLDVNSMNLGVNKSYWPNCAVVHKCGHDSGCCKYPNHVCSPVESENIELYFFSIEHSVESQTGRVERLTFENHTLCDCRLKPHSSLLLATRRACSCPLNFSIVSSASDCHCDCDRKSSKSCRKIKRGKRSYPSKGCIGKCHPPICDYGQFKADFRRCPRKNEKSQT